jgi:hypothetical protein
MMLALEELLANGPCRVRLSLQNPVETHCETVVETHTIISCNVSIALSSIWWAVSRNQSKTVLLWSGLLIASCLLRQPNVQTLSKLIMKRSLKTGKKVRFQCLDRLDQNDFLIFPPSFQAHNSRGSG